MHITINFLASWVLLALAVLTFSGQLLYLRLITLSLAASFAGGAYTAAIFGSGIASQCLLFGIVGGITVSALSGAFDLWAGVRIRALALLASFGFLKIFQAIIEISGFGGVQALPINFQHSFLLTSFHIEPIWLQSAITGLIFFTVLLFIIYRLAGIRLSALAVGDDIILASLYGVSSTQVYFIIQLLGGAVGGFTGVIMANDAGLRPDLGFSLCIKAFGVLIATGGRWFYILPLSLLLILGEYLAAYYLGGHAREAVGFILLGIALFMRPLVEQIMKKKILR